MDAVVVGVPDHRFDHRVTALVVPRPGAAPTFEQLRERCGSRIAGYKVPKRIHVVDAIAHRGREVDVCVAKARAEELSAS
ncbi:AMP-binding enzyme [Yinghuangia aomiensis]